MTARSLSARARLVSDNGADVFNPAVAEGIPLAVVVDIDGVVDGVVLAQEVGPADLDAVYSLETPENDESSGATDRGSLLALLAPGVMHSDEWAAAGNAEERRIRDRARRALLHRTAHRAENARRMLRRQRCDALKRLLCVSALLGLMVWCWHITGKLDIDFVRCRDDFSSSLVLHTGSSIGMRQFTATRDGETILRVRKRSAVRLWVEASPPFILSSLPTVLELRSNTSNCDNWSPKCVAEITYTASEIKTGNRLSLRIERMVGMPSGSRPYLSTLNDGTVLSYSSEQSSTLTGRSFFHDGHMVAEAVGNIYFFFWIPRRYALCVRDNLEEDPRRDILLLLTLLLSEEKGDNINPTRMWSILDEVGNTPSSSSYAGGAAFGQYFSGL